MTFLPIPDSSDHPETEPDKIALDYLAEAWTSAKQDGIEPDEIAHAALFAALASLVKSHGEEATGDLVAGLPIRIRCGEYSLDKPIQ